jgi:hypothetical protein
MKTDIDKLKKALEDSLKVYEDIEQAKKDDDKITFMEGGMLVIKHGGKALRLISSLKEIGEEIKDIDGEEATELSLLIADEFGGSASAKEAISDIAEGAGLLNQGIQKLILLKE